MRVTILSAVAQAERESKLERTNEGHIEDKVKGVIFGWIRLIDRKRIQELKNIGKGASQISNEIKIGISTVYKIYLISTN